MPFKVTLLPATSSITTNAHCTTLKIFPSSPFSVLLHNDMPCYAAHAIATPPPELGNWCIDACINAGMHYCPNIRQLGAFCQLSGAIRRPRSNGTPPVVPRRHARWRVHGTAIISAPADWLLAIHPFMPVVRGGSRPVVVDGREGHSPMCHCSPGLWHWLRGHDARRMRL